ncbi:hypothetical protein MNBD_CHLOROFLEXI01-4130, partial [hydrothermal vent metagenome]
MRTSLRLLLIGGLLTAVFAVASPAFADGCIPTIGINTFEYLCDEGDVADDNDHTGSSELRDIVADQFTVLEPPEDSMIDRRWYGRLADNANVYAEPSRSAPIVRNVGDGYLFSTVNSWADNGSGEIWYTINYGEYVHEDDINLVDQSDFRGVKISVQPERPFGWVVADFFPSTEPDREPDESLPRVLRYTFVEVYDAVLGEGNWIWYDIGDGRWVRQTFFSIVDVNPRPEGVGENEYWVEVDLYEQTFAAYEGDQMVYATLISSGLNRWPTRE